MINCNDISIFYDELSTTIIEVAEIVLNEIRALITNEVFIYFMDALKNLEEKANKIISVDIKNELHAQINLCRTQLKNDLQEISNWFHFQQTIDYSDFSIDEVFDVCLEIHNKMDPINRMISIEKNTEQHLLIKGRYYTYFHDIIDNIYSNAMKHSGFTNIRDLHIRFDTKLLSKVDLFDYIDNESKAVSLLSQVDEEVLGNERWLMITLGNNLSQKKDCNSILKEIEEVDKKLKNPDVSHRYSLIEGKSGIIKINNILKYNIPCKTYFTYFKIDPDEHSFSVDILISIGDIFVEKL